MSTKVVAKKRKIATRQISAQVQCVPSAQFLSSKLSTVAQDALKANVSQVAMYNLTEEEYCTDMGATDVMHNDYRAFVSYTKCVN